jgi:acetyl-CoA carboxylase biotin carboxyl carrier protein
MDLKQIKELMAAMERAGIKKMTIKQKGGDELHLERETDETHPHGHPPAFYPPVYTQPPQIREVEMVAKPVVTESKAEAAPGKYITAPLVGTFYAATSPDSPALVKVGDSVNENTVVCIIEAMKVMNEVKAGVSGKVAEILVENAHAVEFGTKLFRIV